MEEQIDRSVSSAVAQELQARQQAQEILGEDKENFAEFILSDTSVPDTLKQNFYVFFDKENALTNISDGKSGDMEYARLCFEDAVNNIYLFTPSYKQDEKLDFNLAQLRYKHWIKLKRSTGGKDRERALYQTMVHRDEREIPVQKSGGIMSRLFGRSKK